MLPLYPEDVARALKELAEANAITAVKITTASGSVELPVSEIWEASGVLHISVLNAKSEQP